MPTYKKLYTGSGGTPKNALPAIVITNGNLRSVAVPWPSQGFITRLIVKQTAGTNVAFTVNLLDSKIPYPAGQYAVATSPVDDIELYQIIDQQAGTSGNALKVINNANGYPFINQDGGFTLNERNVYLVIKPTSSVDDTTWDVVIAGHDNDVTH